MSTTSLLQTALQNLHVSQQAKEPSHTPRSPSSGGSPPLKDDLGLSSDGGEGGETDDDDEIVQVGKGTAPGTPTSGQKGLQLGQRLPSSLGGKTKDPLRTLPTHIAVRVFLQLDIRTLARCDRVCKRWHKSSTLNYVWFLHNRALLLPIGELSGQGKTRKTGDDTPDFFDPYDKTPRLSALRPPPIPTSASPQWTKAESKKLWKAIFRATLKRSDPNAEPQVDPLRVDVDSLVSSGASTPGRHAFAGLGSGAASRWTEEGSTMTSTERKVAAREGYKALGGRKSRAKRKMGGALGTRDKGGAVPDDGRFDAPW